MHFRHLLPLCALLVAACGTDSRPVTIAAAGPWAQPFGDMNKKGVELAVAQIDDSGGVRGRKLQLIERDDRGDGARAAAVAQEFVADPNVVGVVGHVTSGAMVAAAKVYDGHLAAIATSATSPDLTGISRWAFRVISSDSTNGAVIARFASALGRKRAAIMYENDSYGRGLADAFRRNFDGTIVSIDPIEADDKNLEPYIAYYRQRAADIVFVAGVQNSGIAALREAHRQHYTADFIGGDGWVGIVTDTADAEGAYVGTAFTAHDPRPEVQRFVKAFHDRYGMMPDENAALGYDATRLLARAIEAVGPNRVAVRDYLGSLSDANGYKGVTGFIHFLPNGDPVHAPFLITRVHDGEMLPTGESDQ